MSLYSLMQRGHPRALYTQKPEPCSILVFGGLLEPDLGGTVFSQPGRPCSNPAPSHGALLEGCTVRAPPTQGWGARREDAVAMMPPRRGRLRTLNTADTLEKNRPQATADHRSESVF